jgi:excisionase family DNA binding protein
MLVAADGSRGKARGAMTVEVTVTNPAYWIERALQLAQILRTVNESGPSTIGDPSGKPPDPETLLAIADPAYWSSQSRELAEALVFAANRGWPSVDTPTPGAAPGAGPISQERLTMTVEEAATALGISRAFAYEAVTRNEIPHVRIGRRILIPRAALERLLAGGDKSTD